MLSENVQIKIQKPELLPIILHVCETRSLMLWEEQRMKVF
jgi:hypothetical protein